MPTQDGLRLNHLNRTKQVRPKSRHPYEKSTITPAQPKTRRCLPHSDGQLMAEKQILNLKPAPRFEQVGGKPSERVQDRKHRSPECYDSLLRSQSRPDGIFGKDKFSGKIDKLTISVAPPVLTPEDKQKLLEAARKGSDN
jgi:hypothetical protein